MSTPDIADGPAAFCAFLRASVGDRLAPAANPKTPGVIVPAVFRPDLPQWFDQNMPAAAIIVRPHGGYTMFGKTMMPLADPRLDIVCYGSVQQEATMLAATVAYASAQMVNQVWEGVLLQSANVSGGPVPLPDSQTLWPSCWLSVQLVHGQLPQPADAA